MIKHKSLSCAAVLGSTLLASAAGFAQQTIPQANIGDEEVPAPATGQTSQTELPARNSPEMAWWRKSMETREQRLQWWRQARFGMFIHWGVYSHLGGEWEGKRVSGYAEHIQRKEKITQAVYLEKAVKQFNPTQFNADEWVSEAKNAGMGYMIITAKHHDGFAMFDSKASDYNIVNATPFKRDPMRELKAACDKYGLKFGFYYSHAFDWGDAEGPGNDWEYKNPGGDLLLHGGRNWWESSPQLLPQVRRYVDRKAIPQLRELIKNYNPDIIWFDTPHKLPPAENLRILRAVREAKPDIVINGRLVRGYGDYESTADRPAEFSPHEGDWEGIPTTNESYGYSKADNSHKPPAHFIQLVAKSTARGGNVLMNLGPRGDGTFDPRDTAILREIGKWMKVNAPSIQGTERTPLQVQSWGESTRKGNTLYLHVFNWPKDGNLVVGGLKSRVQQASLLADPLRKALPVQQLNSQDLLIRVPTVAPDAVDSVVQLTILGDIVTDPRRLLSTTIDSNLLRGFDAQLQGTRLSFGPGKVGDAYVQGWSNPRDSVVWPSRLNEAATYDVSLTYDATAASAGSAFDVKFGAKSLSGVVKAGQNQTVNLGRVQLEPGSFDISVSATNIQGPELMRLRSLTLTPVKTQ